VVAEPTSELRALRLAPGSRLREIAQTWGCGVERPLPRASVDEAFERWASERPQAPALVFEGKAYGYGELNARANRLAHCLRARGVGPEATVGICLPRSVELAVSILAVWKAGGAYVPLDPDNPPARLRAMREDAQAACVIGQGSLLEALGVDPPLALALDAASLAADLEAAPAEDLERAGATPPERLAYVMFTSGSSGRPKGVRVEHGSVTNLAVGLEAALAGIGVAGAVRWAWNASYGFDASLQALVQWRHGATLHLLPADLRRDPVRLRAYLEACSIQVLDATPLQVEALLEAGGPPLPSLVVGGEAIAADLWSRIAAHYAGRAEGALNVYGPTETTVDATASPIVGASPRIGRPLANVRCLVLDGGGREQPDGVAGELYIGGPGVARGYACPEAGAPERFVELDGHAGRYYRSGDRVRWDADGSLEYLGRLDGQVKVRGYRIEPEEVAQALRSEPGVASAAVVARSEAGGARLVGYVVASGPLAGADWEAGLLDRLRERLPGYMVPSALVRLDRLPTTANGKLDVRALPAPVLQRRPPAGTLLRPAQRLIAHIWSRQLELDRVGLDENFFELGGQSLLAARTAARIADVFRVDVPLRLFFDGATVRALTAHVDAAAGEEAADVIAAAYLEVLAMDADQARARLQEQQHE
jgi:amino acid adenylation domain-containing protein